MPEASVAFSGMLPNGVEFKIHTQQGFLQTQCQMAIEVAGVIVTVYTFNRKRSGNIEVTPSSEGKMIIKAYGSVVEEIADSVLPEREQLKEPSDLLSGIVNTQNQ